jgi:Zn ribbon nucleic-acid-binding protein
MSCPRCNTPDSIAVKTEKGNDTWSNIRYGKELENGSHLKQCRTCGKKWISEEGKESEESIRRIKE